MYLSRALSVTLAATCLAALPSAAGAVTAGDAPGHQKDGPTRIVICKFGLDTFDVYADGGLYSDGGSIRHASLSQGKRKCTDWGTVQPGIYDLGFAQRIASEAKVVVRAKLMVRGKIVKKTFDGEGVINALVRKGDTVRLNLYTERHSGH